MRRMLAATVFALMPLGAALADYKADYRAYVAALQSGDTAAAMEAAKKAWQAGETELGDHKTVAVLAFNYANIVSTSDAAEATKAYDRALDLVRAGVSDLSAPEIEIALLALGFRDDGADKSKGALREALEAYAAAGEPATDRTVGAWRALALAAVKARTRNPSFKDADGYLDEAARIAPPDQASLAEAQLLAGMVRIAGDQRTAADIAEAVVLLDRAIASFPPQASIDQFDPLLALSLAWRSTIKSVIQSEGGAPKFKTGSRIATSEDLRKAYERATAGFDAIKEAKIFTTDLAACQVDWVKRKPPPYPKGALVKSAIGSVLVGSDLNDAGVERAVVLADLYGTGFGEAAVNSMAEWRLAAPVAPECRKNYLTFFSFIIP